MDSKRKAAILLCFVFGLVLATSALGQIASPLKIVKRANFQWDGDIVGPSDRIQCDADENVWIPGRRGYSSTLSSIVRLRPETATVRIDIDDDQRLKDGSIEYFSPQKNGDLLALVRTVAKYDKIDGEPTSPRRFADTFAVTFDPKGTLSQITKLRVPSASLVTALARLKNGWLVAAYISDPPFTDIHAYVFDTRGNLTREIKLPRNQNRSSLKGTVGSMTIIRPTAMVTAAGDILVFRGFSNQPVYRFSDTGELLETIKLQPDGIEFGSPRLLGDSLFVNGGWSSEKLGEVEGIPFVRLRSAFPIFDLKTGQMTEVLTWMDQGVVGCFDGTHLQVVQQGTQGLTPS